MLGWKVRKRDATGEGRQGQHLEVEDEPGGDPLAHYVDEEIGDSEEPHVRVLQAVLHQQCQQARLVLLGCATPHHLESKPTPSFERSAPPAVDLSPLCSAATKQQLQIPQWPSHHRVTRRMSPQMRFKI